MTPEGAQLAKARSDVVPERPTYPTAAALRRAFEQRAGRVPNRIWWMVALSASWAPFSAAELEELVAWWQHDFGGEPGAATGRAGPGRGRQPADTRGILRV